MLSVNVIIIIYNITTENYEQHNQISLYLNAGTSILKEFRDPMPTQIYFAKKLT